MTDSLAIRTVETVQGVIRPPGSKSITNRALVCAALADGPSRLDGVLDSDDTRVMIDGLARLGINVQLSNARTTADVHGCAGRVPSQTADIFVGNSGTTVRFLTALVALGKGFYRLDGVPRMRQRPIGHLLATLRQLGVDAKSELETNCPPVVIHANGLPGGRAVIRGDISSQYLSAVLMASPYATSSVELRVEGQLVSKPYVAMTRQVMEAFGIPLPEIKSSLISIPAKCCYEPTSYRIEPDASAASYFWGAAAITGGTVEVQGLNENSLQGDVDFCQCLRRMGCQVNYSSDSIKVSGGQLRGVDVDMNGISDTVQTLAAVALFAEGPTRITGVAHIRHKETDRLGDLARELRKIGAEVDELHDGLKIIPRTLHSAHIETYDDHRMAMSLSLVGLRQPGIVILNPGCTNKTYPGFFSDLRSLCE